MVKSDKAELTSCAYNDEVARRNDSRRAVRYPEVATPARERITMPQHMPQKTAEAAYISFALVDALGDLLMRKGVISRGDFFALFETAATRVSESPNSAGARSAEFIRKLRLSKE